MSREDGGEEVKEKGRKRETVHAERGATSNHQVATGDQLFLLGVSLLGGHWLGGEREADCPGAQLEGVPWPGPYALPSPLDTNLKNLTQYPLPWVTCKPSRFPADKGHPATFGLVGKQFI